MMMLMLLTMMYSLTCVLDVFKFNVLQQSLELRDMANRIYLHVHIQAITMQWRAQMYWVGICLGEKSAWTKGNFERTCLQFKHVHTYLCMDVIGCINDGCSALGTGTGYTSKYHVYASGIKPSIGSFLRITPHTIH